MNKFYESKKNPNIKATLEREELGKYIMIYYGGNKDGEEFTVTESTLKRWWKKVDTEVENDLVPIPGGEKLAELKQETKKDVDKEILKVDLNTVKPKKEKKVKEPTKPLYDSYEVMQFLTSNGIEFKHYDKITTQTVLSIKKDGKGVIALKVLKKNMYIHLPEKSFQKLEKEYEYKTENHNYKYIIKLEYETWKETLKEILDVVY